MAMNVLLLVGAGLLAVGCAEEVGASAPASAAIRAEAALLHDDERESGDEACCLSALQLRGGVWEDEATDDAEEESPDGMGSALTKRHKGYRFPDLTQATKHGDLFDGPFSREKGTYNLIGKVVEFHVYPGEAADYTNINWFLTRWEKGADGDAQCTNKLKGTKLYEKYQKEEDSCSVELDTAEINSCGAQFGLHACAGFDGVTKSELVDTMLKIGNVPNGQYGGGAWKAEGDGYVKSTRGDNGKGWLIRGPGPHGPCDGKGCWVRPHNLYAAHWFVGKKPASPKLDVYGPEQYINSLDPKGVTIAWHFVDDGKGELKDVYVRLSQGENAAVIPVCSDAEMMLDQFEQAGHLDEHGVALPKIALATMREGMAEYKKMYSKYFKSHTGKWKARHSWWNGIPDPPLARDATKAEKQKAWMKAMSWLTLPRGGPKSQNKKCNQNGGPGGYWKATELPVTEDKKVAEPGAQKRKLGDDGNGFKNTEDIFPDTLGWAGRLHAAGGFFDNVNVYDL